MADIQGCPFRASGTDIHDALPLNRKEKSTRRPAKRHRHTGRTAALSFSPPRTMANAAGLLDRAQISAAQSVMLDRVFASGLEAMLRDGSTDLIALTGRWSALRVALGR